MIPLVRRVQHLARCWKFFFVPVCITAGMAFAVTWASGPAKAPRETPSITLSDLDGDGDLDMLIESQTPLGVGERESVSQYLRVKYGFIEDVTPVDPDAPTLSAVQLAADDKFRFLVTGDKGGKVVLQFSENLDKWTDMQTYTNESGQMWININRGAAAGRLFFRVRAE